MGGRTIPDTESGARDQVALNAFAVQPVLRMRRPHASLIRMAGRSFASPSPRGGID
jgi:hypothetical protein